MRRMLHDAYQTGYHNEKQKLKGLHHDNDEESFVTARMSSCCIHDCYWLFVAFARTLNVISGECTAHSAESNAPD